MSQRVVFELSLGGGSSSADTRSRRHRIVRSLRRDEAASLVRQRSFTYRWDDGWFAFIEVRNALPRERVQTDNFAGYGWMVDSIIRHGEIRA